MVCKIKSTWIKDNISESAERFEAVTDICMGRPRKNSAGEPTRASLEKLKAYTRSMGYFEGSDFTRRYRRELST